MMEPQAQTFPVCRKCGEGDLVPLGLRESRGRGDVQGVGVHQPQLRLPNLKIRNGEVFVNEPITDASVAHSQNQAAHGASAASAEPRR